VVPERGAVSRDRSRGAMADLLQDTTVESGQGIIAALIASAVPKRSTTPRTIRARWTLRARRTSTRTAWMVAPLRAGRSSNGAIAIWRTGGEKFQSYELEFLVGLSLAAYDRDGERAALRREASSAPPSSTR